MILDEADLAAGPVRYSSHHSRHRSFFVLTEGEDGERTPPLGPSYSSSFPPPRGEDWGGISPLQPFRLYPPRPLVERGGGQVLSTSSFQAVYFPPLTGKHCREILPLQLLSSTPPGRLSSLARVGANEQLPRCSAPSPRLN